MPEGPEVYTIAKKLNKKIAGMTLKNLVFRPFSKYFSNPIIVDGEWRIDSVKYYAKKIIFNLSRDGVNKYLVSFLGMVGSWSFESSKYTSVDMILDETTLYYDDYRKFGRLDWCNNEEEFLKIFEKFDGDYIADPPSYEEWLASINNSRRQKTMICKFLNSPSPFAGIGNYLRADILYASKVHPARTLGTLTENEKKRIYKNIFRILEESISKGGLTISDYWDPEKKKGKYNPLVYGREIDDLGNTVIRKKYDSQTSHFVVEVQK